MRAHLAAAADPVGLTSGTPTFRMTAAMAARRRLLDGAVGTSEKGVAVLMNGRMGQRQATVGLGPRGNVHCTVFKYLNIKFNGNTTRLNCVRPLEVLLISHTMRAQKSVIP